jgi:hypothetical protein
MGVPSGVPKEISMPVVPLAQVVHLSCAKIEIITKRIKNELLLDPRHLGVQSGASKMISKPMVHLAQTMHLSCVKIKTISNWTKASFHLTHIT